MTAKPRLIVEVVVSRPFMENSYIAHLPGQGQCVIVDPGFEPDLILEYVTRERLVPAAILITHGHIDHIAGNETLKRCWPDCPLVVSTGDAEKLTDPIKNLSGVYGFAVTSPPADVLVREGDIYQAAGMDFEVRETPGHSSGHVVFVWKGSDPWIVFGGDVLFQGSVGRTDIADGDFDQLALSIRSKLYTLPAKTLVLPGHGDSTTLEAEMRHNPFVRV